MTNIGKWDDWYLGLNEPQEYGDPASYEAAAEWLAPCRTVADWGCGKGGFLTHLRASQSYIGFDGSVTPFAERIVDLANFRYETEGILLRHVIEHDYRWQEILDNAYASFTLRMALVLFTPLIDDHQPVTREIAYTAMAHGGVPDLSFSVAAITASMPRDVRYEVETIASTSQYGSDTIFKFQRMDGDLPRTLVSASASVA